MPSPRAASSRLAGLVGGLAGRGIGFERIIQTFRRRLLVKKLIQQAVFFGAVDAVHGLAPGPVRLAIHLPITIGITFVSVSSGLSRGQHPVLAACSTSCPQAASNRVRAASFFA